MAEIIWTEPALAQIDGIADYIALESPHAAGNLVKKLFEKIERLKRFPESGRQPPELQGSVYREVIVPPCRVFYRFDAPNVFIVYVMRDEQELRRHVIQAHDLAESSSAT